MLRSLFVFGVALGTVPLFLGCEKSSAEAHREADAAQSDFEKAVADYRQQKQSDLAVLDKSIADLEAKEAAATDKAKMNLQSALSSLKAERAVFATDLRAADAAGASKWDSTKARLDQEWSALKAATDKATSAAAAAAAAIHRPGEMTCEDFVALDDVDKPKIVYWVEGFNKSGMPVDSVVDVDQTDRLVPGLVADCTKNPKASLSKVMHQHAVTASKPAAAAPAPAKMTCQQFVALGETVKPKVIYWADGFYVRSDGGTSESAVVDTAETDRLVPLVVTECKETPKVTLWQKIKRYF